MHLLLQFAEELGLSATTQDFRELSEKDMISGIGRKAIDEELLIIYQKTPVSRLVSKKHSPNI